MEENFFAAMLRSQEQIQVCLDTPMIPAKTAKKEEATVSVEDTITSEVDSDNKITTTSKRSVSVSKSGSLVIPDDSSIYDDAYIVNVTGACLAKKASSSNSLMGNKPHIEYVLTISRIADGATQVIQKRFREIKSFYQEMVSNFEEIVMNKAIEFPDYSESSWLSSSHLDPDSDFVQRRRADLQMFFFEFFRQYPILFRHEKVVSFLLLKQFRPKAHSSYSLHYGNTHNSSSASAANPTKAAEPISQPVSANMQASVGEPLEDDKNALVYNARSGKMERVQADGQLPPSATVSLIDIVTFGTQMQAKADYCHLQRRLHQEYEVAQREKQEKLAAKQAVKQ